MLCEQSTSYTQPLFHNPFLFVHSNMHIKYSYNYHGTVGIIYNCFCYTLRLKHITFSLTTGTFTLWLQSRIYFKCWYYILMYGNIPYQQLRHQRALGSLEIRGGVGKTTFNFDFFKKGNKLFLGAIFVWKLLVPSHQIIKTLPLDLSTAFL